MAAVNGGVTLDAGPLLPHHRVIAPGPPGRGLEWWVVTTRPPGEDVDADLPAPRLSDDGPRAWLSCGLAAGITLAAALILRVAAPDSLEGPALFWAIYFGSWIAYCGLYSPITWRVLSGVDGATLKSWLQASRSRRRRRRLNESLYAFGGSSAAVSFCLIAVASAPSRPCPSSATTRSWSVWRCWWWPRPGC